MSKEQDTHFDEVNRNHWIFYFSCSGDMSSLFGLTKDHLWRTLAGRQKAIRRGKHIKYHSTVIFFWWHRITDAVLALSSCLICLCGFKNKSTSILDLILLIDFLFVGFFPFFSAVVLGN